MPDREVQEGFLTFVEHVRKREAELSVLHRVTSIGKGLIAIVDQSYVVDRDQLSAAIQQFQPEAKAQPGYRQVFAVQPEVRPIPGCDPPGERQRGDRQDQGQQADPEGYVLRALDDVWHVEPPSLLPVRSSGLKAAI
jgi:hypothetical protein